MTKTLVVETERSDHDNSFPLEDVELVAVSESMDGIKSECSRSATREVLRRSIVRGLTCIACDSARNPKRTITLSVALAILLAATGYFTNANFSIDTDQLWTPSGTITQQRERWIQDTFPIAPSALSFVFHEEGKNILTEEMVQTMFDALETVEQALQYESLCKSGECRIYGATGFWNHTRPNELTDPEALYEMSSLSMYDGSGYTIPAPHDQMFGQLERNATSLISAKLARMIIHVPNVDGVTKEWERDAIRRILGLRQGGGGIFVEVLGETSIPNELVRALEVDLPLVPIVVALMTVCSCALMGFLLGIASIAAVLLSILAGSGLLFIIGVPWTSATQLVPFLILGIGLDDAIVLYSSWRRVTSPDTLLSMEDRVRQTMETCGLSIFLTTLTSAIAFSLGSFTSSVPAIYWLCRYCAPIITLVLVYQITFFVACLVETEKRTMRRNSDQLANLSPPFLDKYMGRYADILLSLPRFLKILIILSFIAFAAVCASRIPRLTQELKLEELLPRNSYVAAFLEAEASYSAAGGQIIPIDVYFVGYDFSNATTRETLHGNVRRLLIDDIPDSDFQGPVRSWMEAFDVFKAFAGFASATADPSTEDSFHELVNQFLEHPVYGSIFGNDIAFQNDDIIASRVSMWLAIDRSDVPRLLRSFELANEFATDNMFTYNKIYNVWEFYSTVFSEVAITTALGIIAISVVSLLFLPRWGALHVIPMICLLYSDLVGVVQLSGLHLNGITFVCLTLSIGLLVDFCLHLILRFEEGTRCCRDMLKSMGSSVLMGGSTTLLGIVPLAFSTSEAFRTVFIIFLGIVTLGVGHGLILLPIILDTVHTTKAESTDSSARAGIIL